MTAYEKFIINFLTDLEWIREDETHGVEKVELLADCTIRFIQGNLLDSKIASISDKIGLDVNQLRRSILAILHISMNTLQHKEKGMNALEDILSKWATQEELKTKTLEVVNSILNIPQCQQLLSQAIQLSTSGTYDSSKWRLDIDVAQRSLHNCDPTVSFVFEIKTEDGKVQKFRVAPAMLEKFSSELDASLQAMQSAKRARV